MPCSHRSSPHRNVFALRLCAFGVTDGEFHYDGDIYNNSKYAELAWKNALPSGYIVNPGTL